MGDINDYQTVPAVPIGEIFQRSYRDYADRIAIIDGGRTLTYRALKERVNSVARGLRALGCIEGDRIVLIASNTIEWAEIDQACYVGNFLRVAPITRLSPVELTMIVKDADPHVVLVEQAWLKANGTDWIPSEVGHVVTIGDTPLPGTISYGDMVAAGENEDLPAPDHTRDVWIIYTSGSTGLPKGVVCSGRGIGAMIRNSLAELPSLTSDDVALHTAPLSHFSGAFGLALYAAGGTNIFCQTFDIERIIAALDSHEVTILPLVPTQINMLTDELIRRREAGRPVDTSALRMVIYAGSAIAPDRLARTQSVFGNILEQFYGASEAPQPITALRPEDHADEVIGSGRLPRLASAGRPNRYVEVRVVDADGAAVGVGDVGEIQVRGEQTMREYWRNPEATREVLDANGWVATGDLGYLDSASYLFIVDRKKDMIISGGFNVYPREIENLISTLPQVAEVAVVGAPSERWGEELVAVVVLHDGHELTEQDVNAHCRASIAGYKLPKRTIFVGELPKTATGKINKRQIRDAMWAGHNRRV